MVVYIQPSGCALHTLLLRRRFLGKSGRSQVAAAARRRGPGCFCAASDTSSRSLLGNPLLLDSCQLVVVVNVGNVSFNSSHGGSYKPDRGVIR